MRTKNRLNHYHKDGTYVGVRSPDLMISDPLGVLAVRRAISSTMAGAGYGVGRSVTKRFAGRVWRAGGQAVNARKNPAPRGCRAPVLLRLFPPISALHPHATPQKRAGCGGGGGHDRSMLEGATVAGWLTSTQKSTQKSGQSTTRQTLMPRCQDYVHPSLNKPEKMGLWTRMVQSKRPSTES